MDTKWWLRLFGILISLDLPPRITAKYFRHPDADISAVEKVKKDGYPIEIHDVLTEDNYIVQAFRIRHGLERPKTLANRSVVLLSHGLSGCWQLFTVLGKKEALAYYLADSGFDVWILASRGSMPGKHKYLDWNMDKEYWNFSWHHIGVYDIPATIDYIISNTDQKKMFFIGHSAGNTAYFVMGSERPEYNEKIKVSVSYAPAALLEYVEYPLARLIAHLIRFLEKLVDFFGLVTLLPHIEMIIPLGKDLCSSSNLAPACLELLNLVGGKKSELIDEKLVTLILSALPQRVSVLQLFHYLQLIHSGGFRQYDYGKQKNLRIYGRKTPPDYNFKNCTAPVALMYGEQDVISSKKTVMAIAEKLGNVILTYQVPFSAFTHTDYLFARNASRLVFERTSKLFKDYDNNKLWKGRRDE